MKKKKSINFHYIYLRRLDFSILPIVIDNNIPCPTLAAFFFVYICSKTFVKQEFIKVLMHESTAVLSSSCPVITVKIKYKLHIICSNIN